MPAYISHAIMGEQIYNEASKEEKMFYTDISKDELKGYSLGADFSYLSKNISSDPHNIHTKAFFIEMIQYIKQNKLNENNHIMAALYGHISHYFFDTNAHPFIYYLEYGCQQTGLLSSHNLIEGYLSAYLSSHILEKSIMEVKSDYFTKIDLSNPEISKLINYIYGKIYGDYQMIRSYKRVLKLFKALETYIKQYLNSKTLLLKLSQLESFLRKNELTPTILTNEMHEIYTNPVTGEKHTDSFMDLYNRAIQMTLDAIFEVNKYLYDGSPIECIEKLFTNLSYDTGVDCNLGNKMTYVRKRVLKPQKIN